MTNAEAEFLMGVAMIAVAVTLTAGPLALLAMGVLHREVHMNRQQLKLLFCRHPAVTYHGHPDAPKGMCLRCRRVVRPSMHVQFGGKAK
jgi:hypothetical protein